MLVVCGKSAKCFVQSVPYYLLLVSATQCQQLSDAGHHIAQEVAKEADALVAGSISQCPSYIEGKGKAAVQAQTREQLKPFIKNKADFVIAEVWILLTIKLGDKFPNLVPRYLSLNATCVIIVTFYSSFTMWRK